MNENEYEIVRLTGEVLRLDNHLREWAAWTQGSGHAQLAPAVGEVRDALEHTVDTLDRLRVEVRALKSRTAGS